MSFSSSKNSQYQKKDAILDPKIIEMQGNMMVCRLEIEGEEGAYLMDHQGNIYDM